MRNPNTLSRPDIHSPTAQEAVIAAMGLTGFRLERGTTNLEPTKELPPKLEAIHELPVTSKNDEIGHIGNEAKAGVNRTLEHPAIDPSFVTVTSNYSNPDKNHSL